MKKNKPLIFFLIFISQTFVVAQNLPYFSIKKVSGGAMLGIEIFNLKTNTSFEPRYFYHLSIKKIGFENKEFFNIFYIPFKSLESVLFVNLNLDRLLKTESYSFNGKLEIEPPKLYIIRKHKGLIMPLDFVLKNDDSLGVLAKDFSSKEIQFIWEFNNYFIGNGEEIPASYLKEKEGILRVRAYGILPRENAIVEKLIKIE